MAAHDGRREWRWVTASGRTSGVIYDTEAEARAKVDKFNADYASTADAPWRVQSRVITEWEDT